MSNYPINSVNNAMYRAEAEYILWGNANGKQDVAYALAKAIASWTGFGVPLVQSVSRMIETEDESVQSRENTGIHLFWRVLS